jgi:hypothetical protein
MNMAQIERGIAMERDPLIATGSTAQLSHRSVLIVPTLICAAMLLVGIAISLAAGIDPTGMILPYLAGSFGVTVISVGIFIFLSFAKLAIRLADNPVRTVFNAFRQRAPLLLLPALIFPLFLVGYTAAKSGIQYLVGFTWDSTFIDADRMLFGTDAWRITHGWFGSWSMPAWEWSYKWAWASALVYSAALVPLYASPRRTAIFFTAMLGTWMLGGSLMAYAFASAGPVFLHLVDPGLAAQFQPLRDVLDADLSERGIRTFQLYLANTYNTHVAVKGGGISAMPSMHLGAASIYVLATRGTKWLIPCAVFWVVIFLGSAHLGYHYWVDGIAAGAIAYLCWKVAEACFPDEQPGESGNRRGRSLFAGGLVLPEVLRPALFRPRILDRDSEHSRR